MARPLEVMRDQDDIAPLGQIPRDLPKHVRRPRVQAPRPVEKEDRRELPACRRREALDRDLCLPAPIVLDRFLNVSSDVMMKPSAIEFAML